eukprot:XP_001694202.1 alpha-amylase [Chlamydomonas reinhardtii]
MPPALTGFAWDSCFKNAWYNTVASKVDAIKAVGVTHVWLPPPSQSVAPQGYLPGQLYNLNSKYGTKEQLVRLTQALRAAGIKPIADIVINHRSCRREGLMVRHRWAGMAPGRRLDWGRWAITCNDPEFKGQGNPDTGDDYGAAPDLDHANPELRAALVDWLGWLQRDIGFEGWRLDFARGYGAQFVTQYVDATVGADSLNVGEYWVDLVWAGSDLEYNQDAARQRLCDWCVRAGNGERCCAFDFPTKGLLQEAVKRAQYDRLRDRQGKAPGLVGWWPGKAVTFIENHDTGSTQQHWPFPSSHVSLGYAYILTHPGVPCVFWDHLFDWGEDVRKAITGLVALRRRAGLHSESKLEILAAEPDMYVARVGEKVTVKLGPRYDMGNLLPKEAEGWKFVMSGKDWAVWEKTN